MVQISRSKPSEDLYRDLDKLFQFLNDRLFDGRVPNVMFTLFTKKNGTAHVNYSKFNNSHGDYHDEIALNASVFRYRPDIETLKAIAECMVLVWQRAYGSPGRGCYRNREWADKMISIGLQPSATGLPGGRETGDNVPSYVISGGAFDLASHAIPELGYALRWRAKLPEDSRKGGRRFRFQCPVCNANIWGGKDIVARCEKDNRLFIRR